MGTDIHFVVEKKVDGGWLGLFDKDGCGGIAGQRDYGLFAQLAGVRGRGTMGRRPRGVPVDASPLARYHIDRDGSDGHSHSYLPMSDFVAAAKSLDELRKDEPYFEKGFQREMPTSALFNIHVNEEIETGSDDDRLENYRVVFWFDN